jgi:bifunctional ADP-heptose synthase (sugar kinase/adenylyltransferase)
LGDENQPVLQLSDGLCPSDLTHGAGDCFVGALASRLADGDAVIDACRFANKAAGIFVSTAPKESERKGTGKN